MTSRHRDDSTVIYRIPPYNYLHVLDQNTNVTQTVIGPKTFIRQENERVTVGPSQMITVPPNQYCIIENPVIRNAQREAELDAHGQPKVAFGDIEVRLAQEPFPLYPGEVVKQPPAQLQLLPANHCFLLRAVQEFTNKKGVTRAAGDEWMFEGPGNSTPRKEEIIIQKVTPSFIKSNQALRLCARKDCVDSYGSARKTGEEWLVKEVGEYLLGENEVVHGTVNGIIVTEKNAVHLRALRAFVDDYEVERRTGEERLITSKETDMHIPSVNEEVVGISKITTLSSRQYCVIVDPVDDDGQPQLGKKKLVQGEVSFFLRPGEQLETGIQDVYILGENDGLILQSTESFVEKYGTVRRPGDRWMIRGPCEYVPPVEVQVVTARKAIPLDENEGIYVRDVKTGKVRAICGETYMLTHDEELWEKELPPAVESLLVDQRERSDNAQLPFQAMNMMSSSRHIHFDAPRDNARDKTKMVTYRVHHNAAVQVYDYKEKRARVEFGPDLVMLGPDEQFTQLSLSGEKPKRPNVIRSLCLLLGPDFCTDIITVETADHARLSLQLAYTGTSR